MAENDQKDKTVEKVTGEVENTDKKEKWGQGDSIAPVYSRFASMYEARTPSDLIHFIDQIG